MKKTCVLFLLFISILTINLSGCQTIDHEHIFSKEWTYDKQYHWHETECGHDAISGKSEHIITDGKCDFCAYKQSTENAGNFDNEISGIKLTRLSNRYEAYNAPMENNHLPLIDASTDYTYNYYLLDAGYIKNVPIASGTETRYDGKHSPTISFSKSTVNSQEISSALEKTVSESFSETTMNTVTFGVEGGWDFLKFKGEYSRQWGDTFERQNSLTSVSAVANQTTEGIESSISYTIGEPGDLQGYYRISIVTTCDVYYLVQTDRDNTELIDLTVVFCARGGQKFVLEYSESGNFEKDNNTPQFNLPEGFYKNFKIPTNTITNIITLDECGGYALEQKTYEVTLGLNYKLPVPRKFDEKYEYAFAGWFSQPNGQGVCYADYSGNSITSWGDSNNQTLYAYWVKLFDQINLEDLHLGDQQCYSTKSAAFQIDLDIEALKNIGYKYLEITISGACREYDYKMNDRGRYFVLSDAIRGDLISWSFKVSGFSGVSPQRISIDNLNSNASYQMQLVSDQSNAYNEKLTVGNIVIYITAIK